MKSILFYFILLVQLLSYISETRVYLTAITFIRNHYEVTAAHS